MSDVAILKAMLNRDLYSKYFPVLGKLTNKQKETNVLLSTISKYYDRYEHDNISVDELQVLFNHLNPQIQDKEMYLHIFNELNQINVDTPELLRDVLNTCVEKHIGTEMLVALNELLMDLRPGAMSQVESLLEKYKSVVGLIQDSENDVCNLTLAELLSADTSEGLRWSLNIMNDTLGPLKHSTLGHIFANPDVGKTALSINQLCYFGSQLRKKKRPLLYLNNEEDIRRLKIRAFCSMNDQPRDWLDANIDEAEATWEARGGHNIKFIGGVNHILQVQNYLESFHPRVVFIDQGAKVDTDDKSEGPTRLQRLYNRYRTLASEYECSIITLGQADNASQGRRYLYLNNLDSSKVGIPGELDWCLGIGMLHDPGYKFLRYLSFCKNKLSGKYDTGSVIFDIENCRFRNSEENKEK